MTISPNENTPDKIKKALASGIMTDLSHKKNVGPTSSESHAYSMASLSKKKGFKKADNPYVKPSL